MAPVKEDEVEAEEVVEDTLEFESEGGMERSTGSGSDDQTHSQSLRTSWKENSRLKQIRSHLKRQVRRSEREKRA